MKSGKKIYFASDFHLGVPNDKESREREQKIVQWLDSIKSDAEEIFLVGDVFDFWFEYKKAIPKGFVRFQGKIAELTDLGIKVHWFTGNHDMWIFDYIPKELGVELHKKPIERTFNDTTFFIGHGDGLGPGDKGYKFIKKVFANKICQWLFARFHPNFGIGMAHFWSKRSRISTGTDDEKYLGDENEWLLIYAKEKLKEKHYDYFIFGHRHLCLDKQVSENSRYINLGEWIHHPHYGVFDGKDFKLISLEN